MISKLLHFPSEKLCQQNAKKRKLLWYKRKYTQEMVYKIYAHMREDSSK